MNDFLKQIKQRKQELRAELARLTAAEKAYMSAGESPPRTSRAGVSRGSTIKDEVLETLEGEVRGLKAVDILERIQPAKPGLSRATLSPQLSRLRKEGKVHSYEGVWLLSKYPVPEGLYRSADESDDPEIPF
ncbi:MAG: hypothetical protein RJQ21_05820 [Rhodospirillales bacterium]